MRKVMTLSVFSLAALMFGMSDSANADHFRGGFGSYNRSYSPYFRGGNSFRSPGYISGRSQRCLAPGFSFGNSRFSISIGRGGAWGIGRGRGSSFGRSQFGRGHSGHMHGGRGFGGRSGRGTGGRGHGGHRH